MKNFWTSLPKPILALAPMAGVTDAAFRMLCKQFGADVLYTEFASSVALAHGSKKTEKMIAFKNEERPVVCQLFGNDPVIMGKAAHRIEQLGFDGVDINFGCPAYKVVKGGGGVCLMRNLPLVRTIVQSVCESVSIPVSVKIRGSIQSEDKKTTTHAIDLVRAIHDLPVSALMIHGRSYEKPFDGAPDVNSITEVARAFKGVTLANGGVYTPEDGKRILEQTGADGLGIARGAWGSPWIFRQLHAYLATGSYDAFSLKQVFDVAITHAQLALKTKGEYGIIELRKHLAKYVKGIDGASELRRQLVRVNTLEDVKRILG